MFFIDDIDDDESDNDDEDEGNDAGDDDDGTKNDVESFDNRTFPTLIISQITNVDERLSNFFKLTATNFEPYKQKEF